MLKYPPSENRGVLMQQMVERQFVQGLLQTKSKRQARKPTMNKQTKIKKLLVPAPRASKTKKCGGMWQSPPRQYAI